MTKSADDDKRKRLKAHWAEYDRVQAQREALRDEHARQMSQYWPNWRGPLPVLTLPIVPDYPEDLVGMACGACTRAGTPCKMTSIYANGRCKLHGGLSTGPKSREGKARAALNGLAPKRTP